MGRKRSLEKILESDFVSISELVQLSDVKIQYKYNKILLGRRACSV